MAIMNVAVTVNGDDKLKSSKTIIGVDFGDQEVSEIIARRLAFEYIYDYAANDAVCWVWCDVISNEVPTFAVIDLDGKLIISGSLFGANTKEVSQHRYIDYSCNDATEMQAQKFAQELAKDYFKDQG